MSLLDEIIEGFSSAIDDIRHNVVEQSWFGQETSGDIHSGDATNIEASEITAPEIEAPAHAQERQQESIMEMFTPPAEQEMEQGIEQEQGIDI